jgi:hypothetical protein
VLVLHLTSFAFDAAILACFIAAWLAAGRALSRRLVLYIACSCLLTVASTVGHIFGIRKILQAGAQLSLQASRQLSSLSFLVRSSSLFTWLTVSLACNSAQTCSV